MDNSPCHCGWTLCLWSLCGVRLRKLQTSYNSTVNHSIWDTQLEVESLQSANALRLAPTVRVWYGTLWNNSHKTTSDSLWDSFDSILLVTKQDWIYFVGHSDVSAWISWTTDTSVSNILQQLSGWKPRLLLDDFNILMRINGRKPQSDSNQPDLTINY